MKRSLYIMIFLLCSAQPYPSPLMGEIRSGYLVKTQPSQIKKQAVTEPGQAQRMSQDLSAQAGEWPSSEPDPYPFHNPAGCSPAMPADLSPGAALENIQEQIGPELILEDRSVNYIWNGPLGSFIDISGDPYVYEFEINEYQPPFTYRADRLVTIFLQNGFVIWPRSYGGAFRLLAVSMIPGAASEIWEDYVGAYWGKDGLPEDELLVPVSRKLPCRWMIEAGYVRQAQLEEVFDLDWGVPDYLGAGRKYLAGTCPEAYRVSQEEIGFWDATSMCGPLTWQITHDADGFPYRIGNYDGDADLFIQANPRFWGRRPWTGFDPETYDLVRVAEPLAGYEFASLGELQPGDILFSFGAPGKWSIGEGHFSHIFLVAGTGEGDSRLAVTNLVKNHRGVEDCSISEVVLYTPGDRETGVIHYEWNDHGYGHTGGYGFDLFRWKWISHHLEGVSREYTVRWGETVETIAFDWKVSPQNILEINRFSSEVQLTPGQRILLPPPATLERGAE